MNFKAFSQNLVIAILALFSFSVSAQQNDSKGLDEQVVADLSLTPQMALGLQKERHIIGAFKFYDQLLESKVGFENFEIVIWGDVVDNLRAGTELSRIIEANQHEKLRVSVCRAAMERLGVSEEELPEGVTPVPNAFLRLLQIQAKGYNTVIP